MDGLAVSTHLAVEAAIFLTAMSFQKSLPQAGVSAPHFLAARAGRQILEAGGTALEAAVATAASLAVVYPHMNSIGGDSFWLIKKKGEAPVGVLACGQAAERASVDFYETRGLAAVPPRGAFAAVTVPGTIRGWQALLSLSGHPRRLTLKDILAPAIESAANGFPVSASQERTTMVSVDGLRDCPGFAEVFLDEGKLPLKAGAILRQTALARTLQQLADVGLDDFYSGEICVQMGRELASEGSLLESSDFKACRARIVKPLHLRAFGQDFYNLPEPTQGVSSLAILGLMERFGPNPDDTTAFVHAAVEATKFAFAWRNKHLGDPRAMTRLPQDFLSAQSLDTLAKSFDPDKACRFEEQQAMGDTVWFGVADKDGTVVSCIQSVYWEYGSGLVLKETGVTMQNRGCAFSFDETSPNCLRPGALPFHTLNPAMVVTNDDRVIAYGTMGGEGQPQTQAAVILRHLAGMPLTQAIAEPRWLIGRTWGDNTAKLRLEPRFDPSVVKALSERGHDVEVLSEAFSDTMGHAGAVSKAADGSVSGSSDPRCDGCFEAI